MTEVPKGSNWRHKKSGNQVIVLNDPRKHGNVELLHASGRKTVKQRHYFEQDYRIIGND
jgi:hypothetical protein